MLFGDDRKAIVAMSAGLPDMLGRSVNLSGHAAHQDCLERDLELAFGKAGAYAAVDAKAGGKVLAGVGTIDIEAFGAAPR